MQSDRCASSFLFPASRSEGSPHALPEENGTHPGIAHVHVERRLDLDREAPLHRGTHQHTRSPSRRFMTP